MNFDQPATELASLIPRVQRLENEYRQALRILWMVVSKYADGHATLTLTDEMKAPSDWVLDAHSYAGDTVVLATRYQPGGEVDSGQVNP